LKRRLFCILTFIIIGITLSGCSATICGKKKIVCTIYPEYDWIMNILGDEADIYDVSLMLDGSADLHSYQPTAKDIAAISTCDMLIYVGGESDEWIEDALKNKTNEDMIIINLMDVLGESALDEELVEGMMGEAEEDAKDEHVWLSLKNAAFFTEYFTEELIGTEDIDEAILRSNSEAYIEKLNELDSKYQSILTENNDKDSLIFADRFPFVYMTNDYKLSYYAAFSGCSADSEANFSTITFLAEKFKNAKSDYIFIIDNSDERLANTIAQAAGKKAEVLVLDSMQSVTGKMIESGYSYLDAMENNLNLIAKAVK
jgi:zinc transport system substrate-binding protein